MKTKAKLNLGVGILFFLITVLLAISIYYINAMKSDTGNILVSNYKSIEYCRNMFGALDHGHKINFNKFETNLIKEEHNNTEIGEGALTQRVRTNFENLKTGTNASLNIDTIRETLLQIMEVNMQAIQKKSNLAVSTADNAVIWISIVGTFCFLIALTLLFNLPTTVANPIKELTESIKEIAAGNYTERIHFESRSEFGELAQSFNTMAEKLEEYNNSNLAKLMMEKRRIETLINNMHDPVIGLDENGKIIFANEEMLKISDLKRGNIVGENIKQITATNDLMQRLVLVNEAINGKQQQPLKIYADNKESYFEKEIINIDILPTGETTPKSIGQVIMLKNITAFKELDIAKTNFIATISHELKTPISSIKMGVQLLENNKTGDLNDDQMELLGSIEEDSDRMLRIIGELLEMSRVETGNIVLNVHPGNPQSVIQYAVEATRKQVAQKNIQLTVDADENISEVNMDSEKTAWVLVNLISNAIRYSSDNSKISLSLKEQDNKVCFAVQDFGKGIEPEYRTKIFDRYFQIPGSSKRGSGLGLSISKEFIEAQGGEIGVESEMGVGSTFIIKLNKIIRESKKSKSSLLSSIKKAFKVKWFKSYK